MTIPKPQEKIKPLYKGGGGLAKIALETLIIGLVAFACFMLGRISAFRESAQNTDISVVYPPLVTTNISPYQASHDADKGGNPISDTGITINEPGDWSYAASKTGKVYYPKKCASLNRVKQENRVYFMTREQAEASGKTLSAACVE